MYDPKKDRILKATQLQTKDGMWIEVAVASYDNGEPKVQLSRQVEGANGIRRHIKLGRLTFEEMEQVINAFRKLVESS